MLSKEMNQQLDTQKAGLSDFCDVAATMASLAQQFALAECRIDMSSRHEQGGFEQRPVGDDTTTHHRRCGTRLSKASELGFSCNALIKRFCSDISEHCKGDHDGFRAPRRRKPFYQ